MWAQELDITGNFQLLLNAVVANWSIAISLALVCSQWSADMEGS